jgi:hypothetical protein
MIASWLHDEEWSWWQVVHCSCCCRVGDAHSTDFFLLFSLLLYDFFSPWPLNSKLAAILPTWKWYKRCHSHPTSIHHWRHFYLIFSVTFNLVHSKWCTHYYTWLSIATLDGEWYCCRSTWRNMSRKFYVSFFLF